MQILAIETSCDETAAAIVEVKGKSNQLSVISTKSHTDNLITDNSVLSTRILSNVVSSQIKLHRKYGGVFPELASRAHVEKIIPVVKQALVISNQLSVIGIKSHTDNLITDNRLLDGIHAIAVTIGPGLIGSLLIGVNFAKTLAYAKNLPIIAVNHLLGHIYSNWAQKPYPTFPALILIVSGGHTGLYLMKSHREIKALGETLDDSAGEAFDKVAKLLNLGYPGGPAIAKTAVKGDSKAYNFPRSMLNEKNYNFSFSGLKTAVLYESKKQKNLSSQKIADFSASFEQAVIDILVGKTIQAAYDFKPKSICLCGGVSANKNLREELKKAVSKLPWKTAYHVPPFNLSTDNAAMIGIAASYHLNDKIKWDRISANANLKL